MFYLAFFPILLLIVPYEVQDMLLYTAGYILISTFFQKKVDFHWESIAKIKPISVLMSALLGGIFFVRWIPSIKLVQIAAVFHLPATIFLTIIAIALSVASTLGINQIIRFELLESHLFKLETTSLEDNTPSDKFRDLVIIGITSIATISFASLSSPIYPLNDWFDSNIFFTVGKSMLRGLVPYRDLFEHKGPLIYALHAIAAMISFDTFLGVYFLEIISAFAFLYFLYKAMRLYLRDEAITLIPIIALLVYTSPSFYKGDSAEEFCLPLLMYAFYVNIKFLREEKIPDIKTGFMIGITSACVLWTKFSILGFYIGWIIAPALVAIYQHKLHELLKLIFSVICGVLLATIPFLVYFGMNGAIIDWFTVYFYDNLFTYTTAGNQEPVAGLLINIYEGVRHIKYTIHAASLLMILGIPWCLTKENFFIKVNYASIFLCSLFLTYVGGRRYTYYSFDFVCLILYGIVACYTILKNVFNFHINTKSKRVLQYLILIVSLSSILFLSPNSYLLKVKKSDTPQYQVKNVIERSGVTNPTLLNYGFLDGGFYTITGIVPSCKYFFKPNLPLEEIMLQQNEYIEKRVTDFVVTTKNNPMTGYILVGSYTYYNEGGNHHYYLWQRE